MNKAQALEAADELWRAATMLRQSVLANEPPEEAIERARKRTEEALEPKGRVA